MESFARHFKSGGIRSTVFRRHTIKAPAEAGAETRGAERGVPMAHNPGANRSRSGDAGCGARCADGIQSRRQPEQKRRRGVRSAGCRWHTIHAEHRSAREKERSEFFRASQPAADPRTEKSHRGNVCTQLRTDKGRRKCGGLLLASYFAYSIARLSRMMLTLI